MYDWFIPVSVVLTSKRASVELPNENIKIIKRKI
jgi:hypothetical protein